MNLFRFPLLAFVLAFLVQWLAAQMGNFFREKRGSLEEGQQSDFDIIEAAILTLLSLIIGFSFSMAASRYEQRKDYEEAEANAIGTEYARAGLLPAADAARVRESLKAYLDQRILFYQTRNAEVAEINATTARLQNDLWSTVEASAAAHPTPVVALAVGGMNDVLNSQGYTQAAWWNRIPAAAWVLMTAIAIWCNLLIGYGSHQKNRALLCILPLVVSISFFLIADMDSPRRGIIRVVPQNLVALSQSLHPH